MDADRVQNEAGGRGPGDVVDHASDADSAIEGISLADLEPLTTLLVRTVNSLYRIIVLRGATVLVTGGKSFPEITRGELFSFTTNVPRAGWIGVGRSMEIHFGHHVVVTSPVRGFTIEPRRSAAPAA
jgi:hypothetical protein